jgi:Glycosyl hydrolase catalytic core
VATTPAAADVRGSAHLIGALVALCLSLTCVGTPAWAGTGYVDGISDQNLFDVSWVGGPPSHIELARYVVQWDVMRGAGYPEEFANLRRWYDHAIELQLIPELALDNYNCIGCAAPQETAEYTTELEALYRSFPDIKAIEAWNEPNNSHYTSYVTPAAAAHFMNAAYSFCKANTCTAIAGDFLDSESNMVEYEEEYERNLQPRDPGNWGIHPYHAVKYMTDSTVTDFREALPDPAVDHIWFTEVGAYYCESGQTYGETSQEEQARFLVRNLIPEFQPTHVFYYGLAWTYDEPPPCDSRQADTALYAAKNTSSSLLARSAASVIFGPRQELAASPTASAMPASAAQAAPVADFACEPALDEQWQRGECLYLRELFEV